MKKEKITKIIKETLDKISENELLRFSVMAGLFTFLLFIIFHISSFFRGLQSSGDNTVLKLFEVSIVFTVAWILIRFFRLFGKEIIKKRTKKHVPRYIFSFFNWFVIISTLFFITTSVFGKDASALITATGLVAAGLAFSIKGIVLDVIGGLVLDVERTYKMGDWIRIDEKTIGKITKATWRHVEVRTEYKTLIIIPNGTLVSGIYENLSKTERVYQDVLSLSLDHDVPIERGERVLMDSLLSIPEVVENGIFDVCSKEANEGGVVYELIYGVKEYDDYRQMRHKVLRSATDKLHRSGMAISETFGEYILSRATPFSYSDELSAIDVLKKVSIFEGLNKKEILALSKKATRHLVDAREDLIQEGDDTNSLFVVAEGVVDVIITLKEDKETKEQVVATLGEGSFIGDRALLLGEKRSATVRARTKVLTFEIGKSALKPILKARPQLISDLSSIIAKREMETSQKILNAKSHKKKALSIKEKLMDDMKKFFEI